MNKKEMRKEIKAELARQGKQATEKAINEYIDYLQGSLWESACEMIEEDVRIESLLEKKEEKR